MSRFFDRHDPVEKKYIFNSFVVFVVLVEVLIFLVTLIWQIDEGVFSEQVTVVPFPWKEYLFAAFTAPIAMMFIFGLIIKGFDVFAPLPEPTPAQPAASRGRWLAVKWSQASYLLGLLFLLAFLYVLVRLDRVLPFLKNIFSLLGLWGSYVLIGIFVLGILYIPINLLLRYRIQKKALEYQYLLGQAERHGIFLNDFPPQSPTAGNAPPRDDLTSSQELTTPSESLEQSRSES